MRRATRPRAETIATATHTSPLPPPRATFICRTRKGLKMLVALERVLKGFKAGRGFKLSLSLSSALIEISLSRFYYPGMVHASARSGAVTDKPPCVHRGNKRQPGMYLAPAEPPRLASTCGPLSGIHTVERNDARAA